MNTNEITDHSLLTQYTCPEIISWDPISLGFLVYIDASLGPRPSHKKGGREGVGQIGLVNCLHASCGLLHKNGQPIRWQEADHNNEFYY